MWLIEEWSTPQNLASIELTIATSDRGEGSQRKTFATRAGERWRRIVLNLPQEEFSIEITRLSW